MNTQQRILLENAIVTVAKRDMLPGAYTHDVDTNPFTPIAGDLRAIREAIVLLCRALLAEDPNNP